MAKNRRSSNYPKTYKRKTKRRTIKRKKSRKSRNSRRMKKSNNKQRGGNLSDSVAIELIEARFSDASAANAGEILDILKKSGINYHSEERLKKINDLINEAINKKGNDLRKGGWGDAKIYPWTARHPLPVGDPQAVYYTNFWNELVALNCGLAFLVKPMDLGLMSAHEQARQGVGLLTPWIHPNEVESQGITIHDAVEERAWKVRLNFWNMLNTNLTGSLLGDIPLIAYLKEEMEKWERKQSAEMEGNVARVNKSTDLLVTRPRVAGAAAMGAEPTVSPSACGEVGKPCYEDVGGTGRPELNYSACCSGLICTGGDGLPALDDDLYLPSSRCLAAAEAAQLQSDVKRAQWVAQKVIDDEAVQRRWETGQGKPEDLAKIPPFGGW